MTGQHASNVGWRPERPLVAQYRSAAQKARQTVR